MICPSCRNFRPASGEPCPYCNAPAPSMENGTGRNYGAAAQSSWGGPPSTVSSDWGQGGQAPFNQPPVVNDNSLWGQVMGAPPQGMGAPGPMNNGMPAGQAPFPGYASTGQTGQPQAYGAEPGGRGGPPSLLPVPYQGPPQGGMGGPMQSLMVMPQDIPTINVGMQGNPLAPALPDQEAAIYVPPMYTKPRPIIPRYRAISGLISVLVVFALLCVGTGYYAKATGKLSFLHQIAGDAKPPNMNAPSTAKLQVPSTTAQYGPAANVITSATTTAQIDQATGLARNPTNQFVVGKPLYLSYSIHARDVGTITLKWYTNNVLYQTYQKAITKADLTTTGYAQVQYVQPVEGKVEIYWNNQLGVALLFVVEPA